MGERMRKQDVTLKDISRVLNVSSTTVHRALYGKEGISSDLRKKIIQTANEMGYRLNYAASSMKRKTNRIAVILPTRKESGSMYFIHLWKGYRDYLSEISSLNIVADEFEVEEEEEQIQILKGIADNGGEAYQGILTFAYTRMPEVIVQYTRLTAKNIPVMVLDDQENDIEGLYSITPSSETLGNLCAEFLALTTSKAGTIIISGGRLNSKTHQEIKKNFQAYLHKVSSQIKVVETRPYVEKENITEVYQQFRQKFETISDIIGVFAISSRDNDELVRALTDTGCIGKFRVVGSDLYGKSAEYLKKGIFDAILYKSAYEKGCTATRILTDCMIKQIIPQKNTACPVNLIFKSNLSFYEDIINLQE